MTNRENKVSWINLGWWPGENKVTRIISVLQYCPASLTSVMCKMLEHILCSNIMTHLENNILHDAQHGFCKRRSCESQLILTIQDLTYNIDSKGQTDVILLDISKAFDKVPHKRFLYKLHHYGIRRSHLGWIEDFLVGRIQQVLLEGVASFTVPVQSGDPKGSVLGPLLFLLFILKWPAWLCLQGISRMPSNCRKTWKHYSSGRATGWWSFTPRSAKSCMSPIRGSAWNIHTASMDTPSKWSTQPSTLGLISTSHLNGTTTSTRSPKRETQHQPFCGTTYINAHVRPRPSAIRL